MELSVMKDQTQSSEDKIGGTHEVDGQASLGSWE